MKSHYQVLVIGGGNAGLSVASRLLKKDSSLLVGIIEPSEKHYYQPAFTLVGGGQYDINNTVKNEADFIPEGAEWILDFADKFDPENNKVRTRTSGDITYDYLVVCPGIQLNWDGVEGLKETIGQNGVCSNYRFDQAPYTWELVKNFTKGTALFTSPGTPIKCGGAPQKIMYLASDTFKKAGTLKDINVEFCNAGGVIFGVKKYADTLLKVVDRYGIKLNMKHDLSKIDGPNKIATFKVTDAEGNVSEVKKSFDMIHVTPPQGAPDFIKESPLANEAGWVDVNKHTLQHNKYPNVFSLGDVSSTPNAKTGAAIRKQAPVLVENLMAQINQKSLNGSYNGYGSCPLVTGIGKLVLAEFDYDGNPAETFPFNQAKERYSMYLLKTKVLPYMYWNKILSGKA
jgi:sulfide:quinone oxidoreductase